VKVIQGYIIIHAKQKVVHKLLRYMVNYYLVEFLGWNSRNTHSLICQTLLKM